MDVWFQANGVPGSTACHIFINKIINHEIAELFSDIQNKMRKPMLHRCHAGIVK
jgi:hypothetical protein